MTPFYAFDAFDYTTAMVLGTILGFFFGLVLEGSGFGKAENLINQFYGDDMRVFKVMFSAIVTAMVGMGILGGVGLMDLSAVSIPVTYLWPQIVGGLLLGVGFAVSGYCPGTAVVATGTGYVDGVMTLAGILAGSVAFGFVYPALEGFYVSGEMGNLQLTELMGLPWPVMALIVTLVAIGCFFGAEYVERWLAVRRDHAPPPEAPAVRNASLGAMVALALLGVLSLAVPTTTEAVAERDIDTIDALTLAQQIVEQPTEVYIVDLRSAEACVAERIQGALCLTEEDPDAAFLADMPATRTLVLYGEGDLVGVPASAQQYAGAVFALEGGYASFTQAVLEAPTPPANPTPEAVATYRLTSELHGYFTGTASKAPPIQARPKAVERKVKKGGGC